MDPDFHIYALSPLRWEPEYATHTCHVSILMNKMKILTLHLYLFQRTLYGRKDMKEFGIGRQPLRIQFCSGKLNFVWLSQFKCIPEHSNLMTHSSNNSLLFSLVGEE